MAATAPEHLAEHCQDPDCPRFPCRMFKAGQRDGYERGYAQGFIDGEATGYASGYAAGVAAGSAANG